MADLFPLKLNWVLRLPTWHTDRSLSDLLWKFNHKTLASYEPMSLVKRAIPASVPMKVTEILPRLKDGYVHKSHKGSVLVIRCQSSGSLQGLNTSRGLLQSESYLPYTTRFQWHSGNRYWRTKSTSCFLCS
jgi:hypothetical protein